MPYYYGGFGEKTYWELNCMYPNSVFEEVNYKHPIDKDWDECDYILEKDNIRFFNLSLGIYFTASSFMSFNDLRIRRYEAPIPIKWFAFPKIKSLNDFSNVSLPNLDMFCTWQSTNNSLREKCQLKSFYGCNLTDVDNFDPSISKVYLPFVSNIGMYNNIRNVEEVWVSYSFDLNRIQESARPKIRQYTAGQMKAIQKERMEFSSNM